MAKQVRWTKQKLDFFISEALLTEEEAWIMKTRIDGMSRTQQHIELGISMSTLDKTISRLKQKYDVVQKEHPDILPPRCFSAKELWMDTH